MTTANEARFSAAARGMRFSAIRRMSALIERPGIISFAPGQPSPDTFPVEDLKAIAADVLAAEGAGAFQYILTRGLGALLEEIARYAAAKSMPSQPAERLVTEGSQQGLDLVSRVLIDPGDVVLVELPSYIGATSAFRAARARMEGVRLTESGIDLDHLRWRHHEVTSAGGVVKFLYVVPSFQNPSGITHDAASRAALLELAAQLDLLVVEDDPYGMLSFEGDAPLPLRARRRDGVFYVSTFSKTFAPGLRVGWILAPHAVREKLVMMSEANVLCPSAFAQGAVTQYLTTMPWREQVKSYREIYRERRDVLLTALHDLMPAGTSWTNPTGGLFVWVTLPEGLDSKAMMPRAIAARVAYVPGTGFYADGTGTSNMRLNFSYASPERLREGVRRLAGVMEQELAMRAVFGPASAMHHHRRRGVAAADAPGPDLA